MRAASMFVCVLVVLAMALFVSAQPPPRHESIIILFNDSACTQHLRTERSFLNSSTRCEPERGPGFNRSEVFQCDSVNNVTKLTENIYNNTETCDNTPIVTMTSSAPEHSCAPIAVTFEGQKAMIYGHIECAPENLTRSYDEFFGLRMAIAGTVLKPKEPTTAMGTLREFLAKLF